MNSLLRGWHILCKGHLLHTQNVEFLILILASCIIYPKPHCSWAPVLLLQSQCLGPKEEAVWGMENTLFWPQWENCVWSGEYHLTSTDFCFPDYEMQGMDKHHLFDDCQLQWYLLLWYEEGRGEIGKVVATGA